MIVLTATAALTQTTAGDRFVQSWDLDGNGAAGSDGLRKMRGRMFMAFDADRNDILGAGDCIHFDAARASGVARDQADQRDPMQAVADGMSLTAGDTGGAGVITRDDLAMQAFRGGAARPLPHPKGPDR